MATITALGGQRQSSPGIAAPLSLPVFAVPKEFRRLGLNKLSRLEAGRRLVGLAWPEDAPGAIDNGSPLVSHLFRHGNAFLCARQVRTRPYTPHTNGKAECFFLNSIRE